MKDLKCFLAIFVSVIFSSVAVGATLKVGIDQPFGSIQAAIDAANPAALDDVLVYPGTYIENINFNGKNIAVVSKSGPYVTIIDGNGVGRTVTFANGENSNAVLKGFTIKNGYSASIGGGIICYGISGVSYTSPSILGNIIRDNSSATDGGGISCYISQASLINNLIYNNHASGRGGGIHCQNYGNCTISNNTISGNSAGNSGGGINVDDTANPILRNTILYGNSAGVAGSQVNLRDTDCDPYFYYCDVQGGTAAFAGSGSGANYDTSRYQNNIDAAPLFVGGGDYHLQCGSSCIDAGNNNAVPPGITTDLDGNPRFNGTPPIVDMGAYESSPLASNPSPADDANCVELPVVLSWSPGDYAALHDVYFGSNFNDVNDATPFSPLGVYKGRQDPNSYNPGGLEPCKTYYWRIDEVNGPNIWKGDVWSFTICCPCQAFESRDDIKWSQPPERNYLGCINGWDELSIYYNEPIIADDWVCKDERPIKGIHWWGSFKEWTEQIPPEDEMPSAFHIGIWTDVPDPDPNDPNNFSHPGKLIWENICSCYVWSYAGCDLDPRGEGENDACFKFDQLLSQDKWFYQDPNGSAGTVYWLSIAAIYDGNTPEHPWGWKTRPHFYHDDAVRILPPVAKCPNDCPNPNYSEFVGGVNDNFDTNNFEPATPSLALAALLTNPADFDEVNSNHHFGHTISGLPECIVRAELEIVLRSLSSDACNDSIALQVTGGAPAFVWSRRIGAPSSSPDYCQGPAGLLSYTWFSGKTVTFNLVLSNLPNLGGGTTDLLPLLNIDGHLDVYLQDDTAVDYMILRVWSCPLVTGQWPPTVGSFWENGGPIEYPTGTSWDTAFVLTTNRKYAPRRGYWPNTPPISDANGIDTPLSQVDFNGDLIINFKDFAVLAGNWLTEGQIWPEFDCP
jgi:parallel beta-helix repeat protein